MDIDIRAGRFQGKASATPGWPLRRGEGARTYRHAVVFDPPFAATPDVVAWLCRLDITHGPDRRVEVTVDKLTPEGFDLCLSTWSDSLVWGCGASWIAHEAPDRSARTVCEALPDDTAETAPPEPEKLGEIEGVGPGATRVLRAAGIVTYAQLAARTPDELRAILAAAGRGYRLADPTTWPEQAALAAAGDWQALEALQDTLKGGKRVD